MMQGFYLLAMQQARRRTQFAALACLAAMISLVLAGHALLASPAVPASASITYTVQSENAEQQALADGITPDNAEELARLLENYSS